MAYTGVSGNDNYLYIENNKKLSRSHNGLKRLALLQELWYNADCSMVSTAKIAVVGKIAKRREILTPDSKGDAMFIAGRIDEDKKKPEIKDENA